MTWRYALLLVALFICSFLLTPCVHYWVLQLLR